MDLIYEKSSSLEHTLCDKIIEKFNSDSRKKIDSLHISRYIEWEEIVDEIDEVLKTIMEEYKSFINERLGFKASYLDRLKDSNGYTVQKITETDWVSDFVKIEGDSSTVSVIWYLNSRNFDGETDFIYKKINPEKGKLVMFPATWNSFYKHHHSTEKYVIVARLFNNK